MYSLEENALKAALVRLANRGSNLAKSIPNQIEGCLPMGIKMELISSKTRIWRTKDDIILWDLTHAGKRGKYVLVIHFYNLSKLRAPLTDWVNEWLTFIGTVSDFNSIHISAQRLNQKIGNSYLSTKLVKGVHVAPFGFVPVEIANEHFKLKVEWSTFSIELEDGSLIIPSKNSKRSVKKLYRWATDNLNEIKKGGLDTLIQNLNSLNIKYHPQM